MEIKRVRGMVKPGDKGPGVVCKTQACGPIRFLNDPDELPDPFEFECPRCHKTASYHKHEIRVLVAHRKQ